MIALIIATLIWAFSFGLIKYNLANVDSNFITFIRLFLAFFIFLPYVKELKLGRQNFFKLIGNGVLQFGLMYEAYNYSFKYLQAYEVALFTIFTPLYVTLYCDLLRKKINTKFLLYSLLSVIGAGVIVYTKLSSVNLWLGFLLTQIANISFSIGQINYKKIMLKNPTITDKEAMLTMYFGGLLIPAILTFTSANENLFLLSRNEIIVLFYLGIVASGIGFFLWNYGIKRVNSGIISTFNNLKIPAGFFASLIFFNERIDTIRLIIGSGIIIISIFLSSKGKNNDEKLEHS